MRPVNVGAPLCATPVVADITQRYMERGSTEVRRMPQKTKLRLALLSRTTSVTSQKGTGGRIPARSLPLLTKLPLTKVSTVPLSPP